MINDEKDFDEIMEDCEKIPSVEEVDNTSCPYTLYHLDIGGSQAECKAHNFKPLLEITKDKQDIIGLPRKETKMGHLQRAMTLLNRMLRAIIISGISLTLSRKKPLKIVPMDHNTTYAENVIEAGSIYVDSISALFSKNHYGNLKVTPLSGKELEDNQRTLLTLARKENFKDTKQASRIRTMLYLPAYVILLHLLAETQTQSVLDSEALAYGKEYSHKVYETMLEILSAAQFKHYIKRSKIITNIKNNNDKFKYAMCDFNYYQIK